MGVYFFFVGGSDMVVGYARYLAKDAIDNMQDVLKERLGVERVFIDVMDGRKTQRPELHAMLEFVRDGDTLVVESISGLARNAKDLMDIADLLVRKSVKFVSMGDEIASADSNVFLEILSFVCRFDRKWACDRRKEGLEFKRAAGGYIGGRPCIDISESSFEQLFKAWKSDVITAKEAIKALNLSPSTFYRRAAKWEETHGKYDPYLDVYSKEG